MALRLLVVASSALVTMAAAQHVAISALPAITGPAANACGGCFVVADVAGVIFGGVATTTQTNVVSVGQGRNGSVTTTSVVENNGQVTFVPGAPVNSGVQTSYHPLGSIITVQGATLTSPTSYEVFSAYSVTSTVSGPNGCTTISGTPSLLATASKYAIPNNAGADFLVEAESSFIADLGFTQCSAGGGSVHSIVHSQLTTTTTHITTTGLIRPTPVAQSTVAPSTSAPITTAPTTTAVAQSTVVVFSNATAPSGSFGTGAATFTITPFTGASVRAAPSWTTWAAALVCAAVFVKAL